MEGELIELISEEYVVLDGGFGTILQEKGLSPMELPEEWNIRHPDVVRDIHLDYFKAGAQIVTANTFGGSPLKMGMSGKENLVSEANRKGVQLVQEALQIFRSMGEITEEERREKRFISGSVGPSGKLLGMEITPDRAAKSFAIQGLALAEAGAHLFMVETMMDLSEAELAVKTIKKEAPLPVFASLVFNRTPQGSYKTLFGNGVYDSVHSLIDAGADAVGVNCGLFENYIGVINEMRSLTELPLVLYPNAGLPKLKDGVTYFDMTPGDMIQYLDSAIEAGATIIGGCCGTTPAFIKLVTERIKHKKRSHEGSYRRG